MSLGSGMKCHNLDYVIIKRDTDLTEPKSVHWLTPLNDIAWFLIPGTRVGLLCRVALISPSNVTPTMLSNGKYRSGPKAEMFFKSESIVIY